MTVRSGTVDVVIYEHDTIHEVYNFMKGIDAPLVKRIPFSLSHTGGGLSCQPCFHRALLYSKKTI